MWVVAWREEDMYVAKEAATRITSQGKTIEEAIRNLQEALELYLEEAPDALEALKQPGKDRDVADVVGGEIGELPRLSGRETVKTLAIRLGFTVKGQRGRHVVLVKCAEARKLVTVVPLNPELKPGTLHGVLELAGISGEEFMEAYKEDC